MNYLPALVVALFILASLRKKGQGAAAGAAGGAQVIRPTEQYIRGAFDWLRAKYGIDIARNVERIYRLETANFTSGQFQRTNTPGMQATGQTPDVWPFGWKARGTNAQMFAPVVQMQENVPGTGIAGGPLVKFIAFIDFADAAEYVAKFLKDYGNNAGRWKSTDPAKQATYIAALSQIPTPYAG